MKKLIFISLVAFISCTKPEPRACFTQPKLIVKKGESIQFTNCSENAKEYKWVLMPGNISSTSINLSVDFMDIGQYTLTLTAINKDIRDQMTKTITVEN